MESATMRITVQHALKVPAEEEYSSRQHSVAMELDVPADIVAKGKEAIREYVARVTTEVRSYVEDALSRSSREQQRPAPPRQPRTPRRAPEDHVPRHPPANGPRSLPRPATKPVGNGHTG